MAFVRSLGRQSSAAAALWVQRTMDELKAECEKQAEAGDVSAQSHSKPWPMCGDFAFVKLKLVAACEALGFKDVWVLEMGQRRVRISVQWQRDDSAEDEDKEATGQGGGNFLISCGVCLEQRPARRLAPCGHLTCAECAGGLTQCPFCRKRIQERQEIFQP